MKKRIISLFLALVMIVSIIGAVDLSVYAVEIKSEKSSTTIIIIKETYEEHMIGSTFAVSASYSSDTYSHNADTISYEISGNNGGLILDGSMSCVGTKEDGIVSIPLKALKVGTYTITLKTIDGATDSITIIISNESYDVYLAQEILKRNSFLTATDTIIKSSDYGWMQSNEAMIYFNDLTVQEYLEAMIIRVLVGKAIDEKNVFESYAKATSLVTQCMSGIKGIYSTITEETTFDSINDASVEKSIKDYVSGFYKFNVFDTLSATIKGTTTISQAVKQASYYRVISDVLSVEEISNMLSVTLISIYESEYRNTLVAAFSNIIDIIENTDLKISEYFANTAIDYGVNTLKSLTLGVAKAFAFNSLNAVAPGFGSVISAGMTVYEICKAIDSLSKNKLEAVEINLSAISALCEVFKHSVTSYASSFENNPDEYAKIIVENYKYLLTADRIAVEIQQENIDILSKNLLDSISVQPAFSLSQLLKNIDLYGSKSNPLYSQYLVNERYPVMLDTLKGIIDNEYIYVKTVTEDYLYYSYGMDLYEYTSDLWDIETKYIITLDSNYSDENNSFNREFVYYTEGETLDERCMPFLRPGYDFIGWYTDKECTKEYDMQKSIHSNFTLYAKWDKQLSYRNNDDGTVTLTSLNPRQSIFSSVRQSKESESETVLSKINKAEAIVPLFVDGKSIVSIDSNAIPSDCSSVYIPEIIENIATEAINKSTVIYCWPDSYAHQFAKDNGNEFVLVSKQESDIEETPSEYFTYTINDDEVTITGLVDGYTLYLEIPARIEGYPVTRIGYRAFYGCTSLTNVTVPHSVKWVGTDAFYNCVNLSTITLNDGLESISDGAFSNCKSLISIVIPETVTSLGDCFNDCTGLRELTMPVSAEIHYYEPYINTTFKNCINIEKVTLTKGSGIMQNFLCKYTCTPWYISGCKEVIILDGVSNISSEAFYDCTSLEKVILPNSVTEIGESAFYNCTNLQNITFPNELSSIGRNAFYNCTSIDKIVLPNSLLSISAGAFYGCASLEQVVVGNNVSKIGFEAFYQCGAITELSLPASAEYMHNTFSGCSNINQVTITAGNGQMHTYSDTTNDGNTIFYQYSPWFISGCKKIIINNDVTNISNFAFYNCTSVEHFELPNSLITIGNDSFRGCTNLKSIEIPNSVTCIGDRAFFYCPNLLVITFPKTLEELGGAVVSETAYINDSTNWTNGVLYISDWLYATDEEYGGEYKINPGTKTIGDRAFSYHDTVTKIHIPSSVERIQGTAIYSCTSLQEITVDKQNGFYSSENGMLLNKEKTELICCPNKKGICSIPSGVIKIRGWAFSSCNRNLTELVIPISVKEIEDYAISSNSLQHIFYEGNETEWNSISGTSNAFIQDSEKHYNYSVCIVFKESCFDYGVKEFECPHCGYKKSETILPIGHSFTNGTCFVCGRLEEDCIESSHNYMNNCDETWVLNKPGAQSVAVTFSCDTYVEGGYDYIYIYDANDVLIGKYTGSELAGKRVVVLGDTIKIRLTSDGSSTRYGFALSKVETNLPQNIESNGIVVTEGKIGDFSSDTTLKVENLEATDNQIVYDISLIKGDTEIQPSSTVTVKIPILDTMDGAKCKVYRQETDGSYTNMNAVYQDGYMVFTTDHFSVYVVTEKDAASLKDADYTEYNKAVEQAKAVDRSKYTDKSLAVLDIALAVDVSGKNVTEQWVVDAQTKAILDAVNALEYKSADYTEYNKAVEQAKAIDRSKYTDESLAVLDNALSVDVGGKNITEQAVVDAQTKAILDAINGLEIKAVKKVSMYRLYNENSGEHFYTADIKEKDWLVSLGWTYEGIGWNAPETSSTPVYRLYNQDGGEHHYTTDIKEKNWLVSLGWTDEGIGWYSDDAQGVPLYRQYNPNAFANNHNYTTDKGENDWLVGLGWKAEGIGWYGVA